MKNMCYNDHKYILVVNQYNSDNIGDKLLNDQLCQCIQSLGYKTLNCGFAQTIAQDIEYNVNRTLVKHWMNKIKNNIPEYLKFYLKYKRRLSLAIENLDTNNCIAIIIGGGQLIKHNSVFMECLTYWINWAKENKKLTCFHGIGVDSSLTNEEIKSYKKILASCEYINCRDKASQKILEERLMLHNVTRSPDIAFTLKNPNKTIIADITLVMPYHYAKAVSAFNMTMTKTKYYEYIIEHIKSIDVSGNIVLTATTSSDASECLDLLKYLKFHGINAELREIYNSTQLINIISQAKCVITGRMHAMIIARALDRPVIPILISDKIRQFYEEYLISNASSNEIKRQALKGVRDLIDYIEVQQ